MALPIIFPKTFSQFQAISPTTPGAEGRLLATFQGTPNKVTSSVPGFFDSTEERAERERNANRDMAYTLPYFISESLKEPNKAYSVCANKI
jgi:hypothetical protein